MDTNEQKSQQNEAEERELPTGQEGGAQATFEQEPESFVKQRKTLPKSVPTCFFVSVVCVAVVFTLLFTYVITAGFVRSKYIGDLAVANQKLNNYEALMGEGDAPIGVLLSILEHYSFYTNELTYEEKIEAVLKAYSQATGDRYAEYYTAEEYKRLFETDEYQGIGTTMLSGQLTVGDVTHDGLFVYDYFHDSPAAEAGIKRNDFIYEVKVNGSFQAVTMLGMQQAIDNLSGPTGTVVEFRAYRLNPDQSYSTVEFNLTCRECKTLTVVGYMKEGSTDTAVVRIDSFDYQTPVEFKEVVNSFLESGVKSFVFDLRNNPGGNLISVQAILSYFLSKDDLIMTVKTADEANQSQYLVQPVRYTGAFEGCSVESDEIGMYADLNSVVLCNQNTASAAEIFAATFRDYGLAKTVGVTTYGKGIMQTVYDLSAFGNYSGYLKLTTAEYTTKSGVSYHEKGIEPDVVVEQSEQAGSYHYKDLPQSLDEQLQAAFAQLAPST